ncbi:MAG TPA: hypothetical protein VFP65_22975 [Anaeromyxobacteraceae bacterium]|nr:hypothetical protein [Anaeromyxobacteraceae bacterium]
MRRATCAGWPLLLAATACAGSMRGGGAAGEYGFPDAFEVTQVVTVESGDDRRELLASVRRRAADYEVTLFDPVFATPLVSAALHGGAASEERFSEAVPPGDGTRLVEQLARLYGERFPAPRDGVTESASGPFRFRLARLPDAEACRFPGEIAIRPRLGASRRVDVRTLDVRCP